MQPELCRGSTATLETLSVLTASLIDAVVSNSFKKQKKNHVYAKT